MEQWRDIPGYEGIYQASTLGNIRTCVGKTTYSEHHGIRCWKQRILKQKRTANKKGRLDARVTLWKDGKEKTWLVARLVGLAWCAGYAKGLTINHLNGNPLDNRADNLEWVSLTDNIRHAFATNLNRCAEKVTLTSVGSSNKLEFYSMSEASRFLGRNHGYINNCIRNGRYAKSSAGEVYAIS